MTTIKQRAVSAEQKQLRIEQILDAAEQRFANQSFADIRLVDIAADVGITKAAFYRYFRKKELLFLALYLRHLSAMTESVATRLELLPLVDAVTQTCVEKPLYCKLSGILHTILEYNITAEEAAEFKFELVRRMSDTIDGLQPFFSVDKAEVTELFLMMHQIIIGVWVTANPSEAAQQAINTNPSLSILDLSFSKMLNRQLTLLFTPFLKSA